MACNCAASLMSISSMPNNINCAVFTSKHFGYIACSRIFSCISSSVGSSAPVTAMRASMRGGTKPISSP